MPAGSGGLAPGRAEPPATGKTASRWNDLRPRVLSAVVLVPVALGCIWWGGVAWVLLVLLAAFGLALEWVRLTDTPALSPAGIAIPALVLGSGVLGAFSAWAAALAVIALGAALVAVLPARRAGPGFPPAWGVPYIGAATLALLWLRADPAVGRGSVFFVVLVVWGSDIGAYLTGRLLGGPKLAPAISPGKTVSGAVGGLLAAAAVAVGAAAGFSWRIVALGVCLGVVAEAGDLLESWIKRRCGKKDSGRLIPGHGGLLDRLDALLLVAPVTALLALTIGPGLGL
jgi:phosphatidate cytidylyltransferase